MALSGSAIVIAVILNAKSIARKGRNILKGMKMSELEKFLSD